MVDTRNEKAGVRTAVADRDDNTHTHKTFPHLKKSRAKKTWEEVEEDSWHKKKRENVVSGDCTPDRKISRISMRSQTMTLQWRQAAVSSFLSLQLQQEKRSKKTKTKTRHLTIRSRALQFLRNEKPMKNKNENMIRQIIKKKQIVLHLIRECIIGRTLVTSSVSFCLRSSCLVSFPNHICNCCVIQGQLLTPIDFAAA